MLFVPSKRHLLFNAVKKCVDFKRYYGLKHGIILGIETSCDDTGCAVVDTCGNILGEALNSQHIVHLK